MNALNANALNANAQPPLVAVVGPTASGKTEVGIALAERLDGEIISADAVAVYRGLDIGSAKPDEKEQSQATFHLLDVAEPSDDFTLADFERLAFAAISDIRARGKTPILVGGTGLYVRAITAILTMPHVPPQPDFRAALWDEVEISGSVILHERLAQIDPVSAQKIAPNDAKRIIRALEVYTVTGQPISAFHTPEGVRGVPRPNTILFGLDLPRPVLYGRIEKRVDAMMERGFLNEVRGLLDAGYGPELKSMQSLGYRQLAAHLRGEIGMNEAIAELKQATRRYSKRQIAWFGADTTVRPVPLPSEYEAEKTADVIQALLQGADNGQQIKTAG